MRLLVLGRGKTGSQVAEIGRERGHLVTAFGTAENANARALTASLLADFDVIVDFTSPEAVVANLGACLSAGARIVVGATGWYQHLDAFSTLAGEHSGFLLHGTNFSVGVQAFFRTARVMAESLPGYTFSIRETHHAAKKDAPSGTALSLQKIVVQALAGGAVPIQSTREGDVPGMHVLEARSANDVMTLQHDAFSRRGFAEGAVHAAEWLALQGQPGVWNFSDVVDKFR